MKNFWYFVLLGIIAYSIVLAFTSPTNKMFTGTPHALFYVAHMFASVAMGIIIAEWAESRANKK